MFKRISSIVMISLIIGCIPEKNGLTSEEREAINRKYWNSTRDQESTENLVKNTFADEKHHTLRFTPPRVKGRMLYQFTAHTYWVWSDYDIDGDGDQACEKAALAVLKTINHRGEWQEVMEKIAVRNPSGKGYEPYPYQSDLKNYTSDHMLSVQEGYTFLKLLIDDVDDWNILCDHVNKIEDLDEVWKLKRRE